MTIDRNLSLDRQATREVLEGRRLTDDGVTNWLGHRVGSGAAQIDRMLIHGASMQELSAARGAIEEHLRHLREDHGLRVIEANGIWKFDHASTA